MFIQKFFRTRNIVAIILVLVLMVAAYAYAASNDVPVTSAGDDADVISGYTVTAVQYTLGSPPTTIASVGFNIAPTSPGVSAVREVQVQLVTDGTWFACDESLAPAVTCAITGVTVLSADQFRVVAVQ